MTRKPTSSLREYATETAGMVARDRPFYIATALYALAGIVLLWELDAWHMSSHGAYLRQWPAAFLLLMPAIALLIDLSLVLHRFDRRRRLALSRAFSPVRIGALASGMMLMMGLMIFQGTFTTIKNLLPVIKDGFPHDRIQADIDRWLHWGTDPWRLLVARGDNTLVLRIVEWNYNVLWFTLVFGALFFVATSPRARAVRTRYISMFMLTWILCGNVLAGFFLSAGPVYFDKATGDAARFADLVGFLKSGDGLANSAASYQSYLWTLYENGAAGFGSGISAFPSLHVALVVLNVLFLAEHSRRTAIAGWLYVALVTASSVYLGWHYAIDGYASIALVIALHVLVRRLFNAAATRHESRKMEPTAETLARI